MRRTTLLSTATAALVAMTVLPSIGAAAAEPLADGEYAFTVGEQEFVFGVVGGDATALEGATFQTDGEDNVLGELTFVLGEDVYEVVFVDGVAEVALVDDGAVDDADDDTESVEDADDADEDEDEDDTESVEDADDADDEAEETSKGDLVSAVAACAPTGRDARELGWPNHGTFVSAAARGDETLTWTVVGEAGETELTASLTTPDEVAAFCTMVDEAVAAAAAPDDEPADEPEAADEVDTEDGTQAVEEAEAEQAEADRAPGRSGEARDRSGESPGRSGEAPGRNKDKGR